MKTEQLQHELTLTLSELREQQENIRKIKTQLENSLHQIELRIERFEYLVRRQREVIDG